MFAEPDPHLGETAQIRVLDIVGRRLENNLVLVVLEETVRILSVPAIGRPPGWLHERDPPWLRTQRPQESCGIHPGRHPLSLLRLLADTTPFRPGPFQSRDDLLEGH